MTSPSWLTRCLHEQIARVGRRDPQAEAQIERAAASLPHLISYLGLDGFVDMLVRDDKPRLLLRFERCSVPALRRVDSGVVLKVYGDHPRGEGPLLKEWGRHGVSVPQLETGSTAGCSWLLMEHIEHNAIDLTPQECLSVTDVLAGWGDVMHEPAAHIIDVLRPLRDTMLPRWEACASALRANGRAVPQAWRTAAGFHYKSDRPTPLHGDLSFANLMRRPDGTLILFDASALLGPKEFDAARWSARLAIAAMSPLDVFMRWCSTECNDASTAYELLGVECVLEAGSLEVQRLEKRSSSRSPHGIASLQYVDAVIDDLLHTARSLL